MHNFLICGTPGTGKSSLLEAIKSDLEEFKFINLGKFAHEHDCISDYDDKLDSHIIDEDKLLDKLESQLRTNQKSVIECIHPDMLSSDIVNLVFVCRTDNTFLYDRLKKRDYSEEKISQNVQAEIFQVILDEAKEMCENESKIVELHNNHPEDLVENAKVVVNKIRTFERETNSQ